MSGDRRLVYTSSVSTTAHILRSSVRTYIYEQSSLLIDILVSGFIGEGLSWRWDYWTGALSTTASFLIAIPHFPETILPPRPLSSRSTHRANPLAAPLLHPSTRPSPSSYLPPLQALRHPTITLP